MCVAICANDTYIPPLCVFPKQHLKLHMINNAPTGSIGAVNKIGWLTEMKITRRGTVNKILFTFYTSKLRKFTDFAKIF